MRYRPLCPMPVIRRRCVDDDDTYEDYWAPCDELVLLEGLRWHIAFDGEWDEGEESWIVTCTGGHKLLLPDTEGNDHYAIEPPQFAHISEMLDRLRGCLPEASAR